MPDYLQRISRELCKVQQGGWPISTKKWFSLFGGRLSVFGADVSTPWCGLHSSHEMSLHLIFFRKGCYWRIGPDLNQEFYTLPLDWNLYNWADRMLKALAPGLNYAKMIKASNRTIFVKDSWYSIPYWKHSISWYEPYTILKTFNIFVGSSNTFCDQNLDNHIKGWHMVCKSLFQGILKTRMIVCVDTILIKLGLDIDPAKKLGH